MMRAAPDVGQLAVWRYVPSAAPPRLSLAALLRQFFAGHLQHPFRRCRIISWHIGRD
ncbi:hypothetical protein GR268_38690 [Rhizobium leguminosarum]|nr:hypothetical protein [Rhizobium leguminosarum]